MSKISQNASQRVSFEIKMAISDNVWIEVSLDLKK
jgi:hypothetical protein